MNQRFRIQTAHKSNLITLDRSAYAWARVRQNGRVKRSGPTGHYDSLKYPLRQSPLISCATRPTCANGEDSQKLLSSQSVEKFYNYNN